MVEVCILCVSYVNWTNVIMCALYEIRWLKCCKYDLIQEQEKNKLISKKQSGDGQKNIVCKKSVHVR